MDEFKELIYFFISLIMITVVLTFGMRMMDLGKQMGKTRTDEIITAETVQTARKYSAFDNKTVLGIDVIAALRENALTGEMTITVNNPATLLLTNGQSG